LRGGRATWPCCSRRSTISPGCLRETLLTEGHVAILPRAHRLASRTELHLADFEHDALPRG